MATSCNFSRPESTVGGAYHQAVQQAGYRLDLLLPVLDLPLVLGFLCLLLLPYRKVSILDR